jgi:hypothetical protein
MYKICSLKKCIKWYVAHRAPRRSINKSAQSNHLLLQSIICVPDSKCKTWTSNSLASPSSKSRTLGNTEVSVITLEQSPGQ